MNVSLRQIKKHTFEIRDKKNHVKKRKKNNAYFKKCIDKIRFN